MSDPASDQDRSVSNPDTEATDALLNVVGGLDDPVIELNPAKADADQTSGSANIDLLVCIPSLENEIANHESKHRIENLNRRGGPLSSRSVQSAYNDARRPITARSMLKKRAERSSAYNLSGMSKVAMEMDSSNLNRRRVCHNVCLMVLTFFPIVLLLSISQLLFTTTAADWDPALGPLNVDLQGCDAHIHPTESTVGEVSIMQFSSSKHQFLRHTGSDKLKYVQAVNAEGCTDTWLQSCTHICKIDIFAPEASSIIIQQDATDTTPKIIITAYPGLKLDQLKVGDWDHSNPSTDVIVNDLTASALKLKVSGRIIVMNSDVTTMSLESDKNSVYALGIKTNGEGVDIAYRQPEYRAAFRWWGDSLGSYDVRPTWENPQCNMTENPIFDQWTKKFEAELDGTGGYGVSSTVFETVYNTDTCCGNSCPIYSGCKTYKWSLYPSSTNDFRTFSSLATEILRLGLTQLSPNTYNGRCRQYVNMASGSTQRSLVMAGDGDVIANIYTNTSSAVTSQYWPHPDMRTNPRIRMLRQNCLTIQEEVGKVHGVRTAITTAFVVLDVVASPGVPGGRWIYTTHEVYLAMPPHVLSFLVGGMLQPEVVHYLVHMTDPLAVAEATANNWLGESWTNQTAKEVAQAEVFQQLHIALRPLWDQAFLRGQLVLVQSNKLFSDDLATFTKSASTGEYTKTTYTDTVRFNIMLALYISLAIAGLGATIILFHLTTIGRYMLKRAVKDEELKIRLVKMVQDSTQEDESDVKARNSPAASNSPRSMVGAGNTSMKKKDIEGSGIMRRFESIAAANFNPFLVPQLILTLFVTKKLRAETTNSLKRFVSDCCLLDTDGYQGADGKVLPDNAGSTMCEATKAVKFPFAHFMKVYGWYCYHNAYLMKQDRGEIQRSLIADYNVRIKPFNTKLIVGIRWNYEFLLELKSGKIALSSNVCKAREKANKPDGYLDSDSDHDDGDWFDHDMAWKNHFVPDCCEITGNDNDYILWEAPGHGLVLGRSSDDVPFKMAYTAWCSAHSLSLEKCPLPARIDAVYELGLEARSKVLRRIDGLSFKTQMNTAEMKMPVSWWIWEIFDVVLHMSVLFVIPLLLLVRAMQCQYSYSTTFAAIDDGPGPLMWYDILSNGLADMDSWHGKFVLPSVKIIVIEVIAYLCCAVARMVFHYLELPHGIVKTIVNYAFSFVLYFQTWVMLVYIMLVLVWAVLAAVLSPKDYLVYGVAIGVGGVVVAMTYKELTKAVQTFQSLMTFALQDAMKTAVNKAAKQQSSKRMEGSVMQEASKSGIADANDDGEFDANDLFHLLNKDDDDVLSIDEFKNLFTELDIDMSEEKQDMLLAICDIDGSGEIDQEEFVNAWEYFQQVFVEEAAAQAGLGYWHVAVTVVCTLIMVLLLFAFLFLAMAAWSNEDDFVTVIRSLIITVMGGAIGVIRPNRNVEDGDEYKRQVESSVGVFKGGNEGGDY